MATAEQSRKQRAKGRTPLMDRTTADPQRLRFIEPPKKKGTFIAARVSPELARAFKAWCKSKGYASPGKWLKAHASKVTGVKVDNDGGDE